MGCKKVEKITSLIVSLVVTCLSFVNVQNWTAVGIYAGCGLANRMIYPFFHANFLHAVLNAWCLLSVVFVYEVSIGRLILSYIVAATIPVTRLSSLLSGALAAPTVGLSGMVFFLFGSISFEVLRKWYYQLWMLSYIAVGFLFPNTNAWLHLYCYIVGLAAALLAKPVKIS